MLMLYSFDIFQQKSVVKYYAKFCLLYIINEISKRNYKINGSLSLTTYTFLLGTNASNLSGLSV